MGEVFSVSLTPYAAELKEKQKRLEEEIEGTPADKAGKLLLEYAEVCEALGHWYRQKGHEIPDEFDKARKARQGQYSRPLRTDGEMSDNLNYQTFWALCSLLR